MASTIPNLSFNPNQNLAMPQFNSASNLGYQSQSIFMQPIGSIYGLSNSSEVGNIPIGSGVSMGLCLSEGVMYLKSMQNNGPVLLGYKLSPLENTQRNSGGPPQDSTQKIEQLLKQYDERFSKIEKALTSIQTPQKGGKQEWQI